MAGNLWRNHIKSQLEVLADIRDRLRKVIPAAMEHLVAISNATQAAARDIHEIRLHLQQGPPTNQYQPRPGYLESVTDRMPHIEETELVDSFDPVLGKFGPARHPRQR